jgi:hypothetical protein
MYIVIECFPHDHPSIVVDPEDGCPIIFDTEKEAQAEADQCQKGIVVWTFHK